MSRQINANSCCENEDVIEVTEEAFLDQCDSCCYDFQQGYPYKCMFNEILNQYKMRLKKAQAEMNERDMMISVLKDQHNKMENYCRCTIEEMRNIKVKYIQLLQELDSMKNGYSVCMNSTQPSNGNVEPLETYIRSEVEVWKKENKETLGKIEMIDCDVQKLLHIVSESPKPNSAKEIEERMARLEKIIAEQSNILSILHSKVIEDGKALTSEGVVRQKSDKTPDEADLSSVLSYPKATERNKQKNFRDVGTNTDHEIKSVSFINRGYVESDDIAKEVIPEKRKAYLTYGASACSEKSSTVSEQIPCCGEGISGSSIGSRTPNYYNNYYQSNGGTNNKSFSTDTKASEDTVEMLNIDKIPTPPSGKLTSEVNIELNENTAEIISWTKNTNFPQDVKNSGNSIFADAEPIEDLLEIADKERQFFGQYVAPLNLGVDTPPSSVPEQQSRNERTSQELPVDPEKPESNTPDFENFNEIEHFESPFYESQKNNDNFYRYHDEINPEETELEDVPTSSGECSKDNLTEGHEGQLIAYEGTESDKKPSSPEMSKDSDNNLNIEEMADEKSNEQNENVGYLHTVQEFPVSEEEIEKKSRTPVEQVPAVKTDPCVCKTSGSPPTTAEPSPDPRNASNQSTERILEEFPITSSLKDDLKTTINRLDDILGNAGREMSLLHELKENMTRVLNEEGLKDIPAMKKNTDNMNQMLNKIKDDLNDLKSDMKNVLNNQDEQLKKREAQNESDAKKLEDKNIAENNRVLQTVKSLEKRLCKCSKAPPKENESKACVEPPKECACRYKKISLDRKKTI